MEKTIGLAISLVGVIGTLIFVIKLLPGFMFALIISYFSGVKIRYNM